MFDFVNSKRFNSPRPYLRQWFERDTVIVTDSDLQSDRDRALTQNLLLQFGSRPIVVDLTHNPIVSVTEVPSWLLGPRLTNSFDAWYDPQPNVYYFPVFLWMFSLRSNLWYPPIVYDAGRDKTQEFQCLNSQPRPHRTWLWDRWSRSGFINCVQFSFVKPDDENQSYTGTWPRLLDQETLEPYRADVGVAHPVYDRCAVNIVTETRTDRPFVSEKTCKPFMARQIPVIVSSQGVNQFLEDLGLDMFSDLIPWQTWDSESNTERRLELIAQFVEAWYQSGTVLKDYASVLYRIENNKQYFHSELFRTKLMQQMSLITL